MYLKSKAKYVQFATACETWELELELVLIHCPHNCITSTLFTKQTLSQI